MSRVRDCSVIAITVNNPIKVKPSCHLIFEPSFVQSCPGFLHKPLSFLFDLHENGAYRSEDDDGFSEKRCQVFEKRYRERMKKCSKAAEMSTDWWTRGRWVGDVKGGDECWQRKGKGGVTLLSRKRFIRWHAPFRQWLLDLQQSSNHCPILRPCSSLALSTTVKAC